MKVSDLPLKTEEEFYKEELKAFEEYINSKKLPLHGKDYIQKSE